ncbi:MAG TPA: sensor domain-containing diguanylate cyclase, partial [Armatimonadota bacterium]
LAHTLRDGANREADVYLRHAQGHRCPVAVRVAPVRDASGEIIGAVEVFNDITERVKALEQLERLRQDSLLDLLTGLPNRRFLEMQLASRMLELSRYGRGFGVLFIDVDHFKEVNDVFGHEVGDRALHMVGSSIQTALRGFDVVGRWGGEEFVALIMDVGAREIRDTAERVRVLVERSRLPVEPSPPSVTLSIGATLARPDESVTDLVSRADHLMYQAKREGRNRVACDPGTP